MLRTIKVGNQEMDFKASAATPILYKKLFGTDLILELTKMTKLKTQEEQATVMSDLVSQMAYIMYCEASMSASELFTRLKFEGYIEWLSKFENTNDILSKGAEFIALYQGNTKVNSEAKNE